MINYVTSMSKKAYLHTMGIDVWKEKQTNDPASQQSTSIDKAAQWTLLEQRVEKCTACDLYRTRTRTVFGTGNREAELMIIGEAPGADEDAQGKPFVGRAGQLLTQMLKAIDIARENIFITNILKSRPPNNREPAPEEVSACTPFLKQQIQLIQPKLLVALGRVAARFLLNDTESSLGSLRSKIHTYQISSAQKIPLIITYHPAYLLRSPGQKAKSYEDLRQVKQFLAIDRLHNHQ